MSTLKDVAQAAGVSESTASRALNGNPRISAKTRALVKRCADKLNYHPNFSAKNLSQGSSRIIAVIFPSMFKMDKAGDLFLLEILQGINEALDSSDYKIMLIMGRNKHSIFEQVQSMAEEVKVENFILLYSAKNDPVINYLNSKKINYVIVGHAFQGERFVDNDNLKVGEAATKLILTNPRVKSPIFIRAEKSRPFEDDREAGYRKIMLQNGLRPDILTIDEKVKIDQYLSQLDGIIFSDDRIFLYYARQVLKYDLPIVCFNNSELIKLIFDHEMMIDLRPRLLGKKAVELLFNPEVDHFFVTYRIKKS